MITALNKIKKDNRTHERKSRLNILANEICAEEWTS